MRFSLLDLRLYLIEVHSIMKFAVQVTVHYLRSWHIIHELPSMHGHVTWYIIYHMIRHLPSIHTFIYHVSFLLLLFYSGETSFYRLQVRLRLRVGYLFLSEARNIFYLRVIRSLWTTSLRRSISLRRMLCPLPTLR